MCYTLDLFVAELRCPRCGHVSAADDATNMQTKIRDNPELAWLGVDSALELDPATVPDAGYYLVQPPGDTIRILQIWACPTCESYPNWGRDRRSRWAHREHHCRPPRSRDTRARPLHRRGRVRVGRVAVRPQLP
jgi:hypothetical protein